MEARGGKADPQLHTDFSRQLTAGSITNSALCLNLFHALLCCVDSSQMIQLIAHLHARQDKKRTLGAGKLEHCMPLGTPPHFNFQYARGGRQSEATQQA